MNGLLLSGNWTVVKATPTAGGGIPSEQNLASAKVVRARLVMGRATVVREMKDAILAFARRVRDHFHRQDPGSRDLCHETHTGF
ncbi:MAG: hypothetical protein HYY24_01160 [Verrucomicrobia bacterium]|nr:hypothetical protein [Verrucomicrobiota bacterium]